MCLLRGRAGSVQNDTERCSRIVGWPDATLAMGGGRQLVEVGREMSPIGGLVRDQLLPTVAGVSVAGCNVGMDDGCNDVGATDVGGNVTDGSGGIVGIKEAAGCGTAVDDSSDTCVTCVTGKLRI